MPGLSPTVPSRLWVASSRTVRRGWGGRTLACGCRSSFGRERISPLVSYRISGDRGFLVRVLHRSEAPCCSPVGPCRDGRLRRCSCNGRCRGRRATATSQLLDNGVFTLDQGQQILTDPQPSAAGLIHPTGEGPAAGNGFLDPLELQQQELLGQPGYG